MLYGFQSCNYLISADRSLPTGKVYDEQKNHEQMPSITTEHQRSFLVTLSARVLGSAGLGLSILAIWFRWFIPSSAVSSETMPNKPQTRHPRRSAPSPTISPLILPPIRRATTPLLPSLLRVSQEPSSNRHRRVYFLDSKLPTIKSQQILSSAVQPQDGVEALEQLQSVILQSQLEDSSPLSFSSSTTLVTDPTYHEAPSSDLDGREESIAESDCSSRRSSISIRLPKMNPFLAKGRRGSGTSEVTTNNRIVSTPTLSSDGPKATKKSNVGFAAPWSINKSRPTTAETLPEERQTKSSSPSRLSFRRLSGSKHVASATEVLPPPPSDAVQGPSQSPLTSYFSRKPQRRSSTPIPVRRTSPYEAPHFATPPIPYDASYSAYLRGLPQFGDDMNLKTARVQMPESEHSRGRTANTEAQAALGLGRPRVLPKRRSASEGWTGPRNPRT